MTKRSHLEHADAATTSAGLAAQLGANLPLPALGLRILAAAQTNALLVEATPQVFEQVKALLEELDKPAPDEAERR